MSVALIPHLQCREASKAAEFYQRAFGAEVNMMMPAPDGRLMHGELQIGEARLMLCDLFEECGDLPQAGAISPVTLHLQVDDCDALFQRALDAGCETVMPLEDMFWGDRYGVLSDPFGHRWSIASHVRDVSPEALQEAMQQFSQNNDKPGCA
ncbi:glyoxalase/bleomycin resistance protein/dioxygenase [Alcanivorax sp. S71-1-4]|uniref:VOC family protein n=1 Tax=Alcanivorax sp. S71-1-4 TaxID=1177159 RepID=UPI00135C15D2|nr:VOC family protein [Alcanivorax sp. S71-1-4]KAF0809737.1 glyoxalase/bleomycin resistance protein/dioxygenase [Alcanivorax sp. S71-1-4]